MPVVSTVLSRAPPPLAALELLTLSFFLAAVPKTGDFVVERGEIAANSTTIDQINTCRYSLFMVLFR